ncbi:hypothetical protein [Arenibaculum pallidiluteum]|uniref:hypothetical protein n=1 Tax=Arenibaculum pallidiluteum TaxID=2812559 RepID=UPI001A973C61|nr:hypothetical protein [Arenibaculum pallidiluteum]
MRSLSLGAIGWRSRLAWLRDYAEAPTPTNIVGGLDRLAIPQLRWLHWLGGGLAGAAAGVYGLTAENALAWGMPGTRILPARLPSM